MIIIAEGILAVLLYLALRSGVEISSGPDEWISLKPINGAVIQQKAQYETDIGNLRSQLDTLRSNSVSRKEYDDLLNQLHDLRRTSINVGLLPESVLQFDPKEAVSAIKSLIMDTRTASGGDIGFSVSVVSREVEANWIINTKQPANATVKNLNYHIQKCLASVGAYTADTYDGEMRSTYDALVRYQTQNGLKPDGILGKRTWNSIKGAIRKKADES